MSPTQDVAKYQTSNPLARWLLQRFITAVVAQVDALAVGSVLDAGCGEGFLLQAVLNICRAETKVAGFELQETLLHQAQTRLPALELWQDNVLHTRCQSKAFELVICTEVLEHLDEPESALQELLRISSRYVLLSVPQEPFFTIISLLRGKYLSRLGRHPEHIQAWSKGEFAALVGRHARLVRLFTVFPWTIVLAEKRERA